MRILVFLLVLGSSAYGNELYPAMRYRTWTSSQGETFTARYCGLNVDARQPLLLLRCYDGQYVTTLASAKDVGYLKKIAPVVSAYRKAMNGGQEDWSALSDDQKFEACHIFATWYLPENQRRAARDMVDFLNNAAMPPGGIVFDTLADRYLQGSDELERRSNAISYSQLAAEPELVTLFKRSVREAAKALDEAEIHVKYERTTRSGLLGEQQKFSRYPIETLIRPNMALYLAEENDHSCTTCANDRYAFSIVQTIGEPTKQMIERDLHGIRFLAFSTYYVHQESLAEIVASKNFKPLSAQRDGRYVEVVFEHESHGNIPTITDAYVVCDAERNWAIVEYAATINRGGAPESVTCTNTLSNHASDIVIAKKSVKTAMVRKRKAVERNELKLVEVFDEAPKHNFFLAHFGFKEQIDEMLRWLR